MQMDQNIDCGIFRLNDNELYIAYLCIFYEALRFTCYKLCEMSQARLAHDTQLNSAD